MASRWASKAVSTRATPGRSASTCTWTSTDRTQYAVAAFQRDHRLDVDGIAGNDTLQALKTAQAPRRDGASACRPRGR
ncbi:peptidoglycan-binding domain-containing protein [Pantoea ananatis]|uniref:peptidoglycan-binding domain-containing protein n=1 Tax=Pantoea ananas TaxID=553 RepID=UPI0039B917AA